MRLRVVLGLLLLAGAPRPASAWNFDWSGVVDVAAEKLNSAEVKDRVAAIGELSAHDISLTQGYLMKALEDSDAEVRQAAARALGAGAALVAVPKMIDWLSDPTSDAKLKGVAADVLGDIGGPDATAALTRSLGDNDATVRQRAVRALGAIGKRGNLGVVIALIPRLEDDKSEVKHETIDRLEELGDKRAVIPLVARFGDGQLVIRIAAIRAVGKLGDPSAVPALIRLVGDPMEDVRMAAVGSLGSLGATTAIDALMEQLGSGSDVFRAKVAYALGQIAAMPGAGNGGAAAMRTLVGNLGNTQQRAAAREALRVAGKAAVPALIDYLQGRIREGDPTTAVTLLSETGDSRATATLAAELERGRVATPLVLKALGATGDPAALVPVLGGLANKDAAIRLAAMEALRPLIGNDARAGDVLIEHLTDDDLEVRVLAAEYLGIVKTAAATPKLIALAGAGNPMRLRLASIDSLGEIGEPSPTAATNKALVDALIDVLREGPVELHRSAATALSYIADPQAIGALVAQAQADRGATRHEVVRALGATLRGHADARARKLLRTLAQDVNVKVALAAIAGLAAANDPADAAFLRTMVDQAAADRRRAAAWALGELHDASALDTLIAVTSTKDDRLIGDALWSLGEILAASPKAATGAIADRMLYLAQRGSWATAIDATAALARILWAQPRETRAEWLTAPRRTALLQLAFHKSRLARINVATALGSLANDDEAQKTLTQLLRDERSPHVRIATAIALGRIGKEPVIDAESDPVRAAVKLAKGAPYPPARGEWRMFYVVDTSSDDAPVRQEPYFVQLADGIVWATYTDARGELASEHVPSGDATPWPASREAEY